MIPALIVAGVIAVVVVVVVATRKRGMGAAAPPTAKGTVAVEAGRIRPQVAEFHVTDGAARVHFEVPLPPEGADEVLAELLGREAVEVVREKRHSLPIGDVSRVVAYGRRGADWAEVSTISLDTPGELPPPMLPELIPHAAREFDPFEHFGDLPQAAPGLAAETRKDSLDAMRLTMPASAQAGLRTQGLDPASAAAPDVVLGLLRTSGYSITPGAANTFTANRAGQRTFIRVVPHDPSAHPELSEQEIRTFVVDFGSSGADRGLLITEKYSPFEIYERERRDPRVRFVTRERLQGFVDALAMG